MAVTEIEKTDEQNYDEIEKINNMFPNAMFTVAMDIEDLDDIVTNLNNIVITNTYDCYCYDNRKEKKTDVYYIEGPNITNKFIINTLIEHGLSLECNHRFLEGFCKIPNSTNVFEIMTGS
jgi:hypothetical protein